MSVGRPVGTGQRLVDRLVQARRRVKARGGAERFAQRQPAAALLGAGRAGGEVLLELGVGGPVQLAVEAGIENAQGVVAVHDEVFRRGEARTRRASCSRPRESRDMTVPIGTPTTALIS